MLNKNLLTLTIITISFFSIAQKAKDKTIKTNFHYLIYPEREGVSTKYYAMSISEEYSCDGAIPAKTYKTPISADPRGKFYLDMIPSQKSFFLQAKDLYGNMITKKKDFTDITIHTGDIRLTDQKVSQKTDPDSITEKLYFLDFVVSVPIEISIRRRGNMDEVLIEANSKTTNSSKFSFPTGVIFSGGITDIKRNGYSSKAELMKAWNKYKKHSTLQWRDKLISGFLKPVYKEYKQRFMLYSNWDQAKIVSDKNKKGGYENMVTAANNYIAVFEAIESDYKAKKYSKQWTKEYQEQLNLSLKIWESFLSETNFDVTVDDRMISDKYRQKILLNYVQGLIYTGQFDKVNKLINEQLKKDINSGTSFDLKRLKGTLNFEKKQFEINSESKEWVKL